MTSEVGESRGKPHGRGRKGAGFRACSLFGPHCDPDLCGGRVTRLIPGSFHCLPGMEARQYYFRNGSSGHAEPSAQRQEPCLLTASLSCSFSQAFGPQVDLFWPQIGGMWDTFKKQLNPDSRPGQPNSQGG